MQLLGRVKFLTEDENPKGKVKFLKGGEFPRNFTSLGVEIEVGQHSWDTGSGSQNSSKFIFKSRSRRKYFSVISEFILFLFELSPLLSKYSACLNNVL